MGSKSRISKHIVPIIQSYIDENNIQNYLEPFVGGANVIDKVVCENKFGNDINEHLIELFLNLDKVDSLPKSVSRRHYSEVRESFGNNTDEFPKWYVGAVGFLASYNGRFFDGGYAGVTKTKIGTVRDYYDEAKRNLINQIPNLCGINWSCLDYRNIPQTENYVIYCDIPYRDTTQYDTSKDFDHDEFWEWAREVGKNNIVLISECQAPKDFDCIWQQEIVRTLSNQKRVPSVEKLFMYGR